MNTDKKEATNIPYDRGHSVRFPRFWRWMREPMLHFAVLGVLTYAIYAFISGPAVSLNHGDNHTIVVDRTSLLKYLQFQLRRFNDEDTDQSFDTMDSDELAQLVRQYVRDEVLYRQAKRLGMENDDFVIRNRMIQKVGFVYHSVAEDGVDPTDTQVRAYYDKHSNRYRDPAVVTFTHIFFDNRNGGEQVVQARAKAAKKELNSLQVPFDQGARHGDRFLYKVNYVESTEGLVGSHFGAAMAKAVFALEPNITHWQGPFESPYGAHLVMETENEPARTLPFEQVRSRVADDLRRHLIKRRESQVINALIEQYQVDIKVNTKGPITLARIGNGGNEAGKITN